MAISARAGLTAVLFLLAILAGFTPALAARTLIVNANGYTIDHKGKVRRFATLLIGADGRLVEVLPRGRKEPALEKGDYRLDAGGRTLLPGFIDAHGHIMRLGLQLRGRNGADLGSASPGDREKALAAALVHLAARGITGVHDIGTSAADWALFRAFADEGRLRLRITAYADGMAAMEAVAPLRPTPWLYEDRLRLQGVRIAVDGGFADHGAWLKSPYADRPGDMGAPLLDDAQVKNLFSRANYFGYQAVICASGDAAVGHALDSLAEIRPAYGGKYRNRIEHADLVDPADIGRFAVLETIASMQPLRAVAAPQMLASRLGAGRAAAQNDWRSLRDATATLALGTGFPDHGANILAAIQIAVTHPGTADEPARALTLLQALHGFTRGAAYAGHMDDRLGSLEPGKWADFIFVDRDPFQVEPQEIGTIRVLETWLAGGRIYQADQ